MLQNNFIAALITLGIIKSSSNDEDASKIKKIQNAKWWKTILYAILCVFCLILIVKTYTVTTIEKRLEINYISGSGKYDSISISHVIADTINCFFYQRFGKHNIDSIKNIKEKLPYTGGFDVCFKYHMNPKYKYTKDSVKDENGKIVDLYSYCINKYPNIKEIDRHNIEQSQFISRIDYLNTEIPSLIPIANKIKFNSQFSKLKKNKDFAHQALAVSTPFETDTIINNDYGIHSEIFSLTMLQPGHSSINEIPIIISFPLEDFNELGWLTAADVSQVTMIYKVISDYNIDTLGIHFDLPVEIPEIYPKPDFKENFNLIYVNPFDNNTYNKQIKEQEIRFHAHIPQLANLQLIRSLLLTTVFTALIALFFTNLYNCFVRYLYMKRNRKENKKKIDEIIKIIECEKKRLLKYNYIIAFIIVMIFAYSYYRVIIDKPFQFSFPNIEFIGINITSPALCYCYFILFIILIWILFNLILIEKYMKKK